MHSVIVGLVVPWAVLIVSSVLYLLVKLHRTPVAKSCQVDVVSADVRCHVLVTQLWPCSPGSIVALHIFVPSLHLACYTQTFVRTISVSSFAVGRRKYILRSKIYYLLSKLIKNFQFGFSHAALREVIRIGACLWVFISLKYFYLPQIKTQNNLCSPKESIRELFPATLLVFALEILPLRYCTPV